MDKGHEKKRYRYRLWLHEVESIDRLSRLIQQADRAQRLLETARMAAIGLTMSPYVMAASELQGVQVVLGNGTQERLDINRTN